MRIKLKTIEELVKEDILILELGTGVSYRCTLTGDAVMPDMLSAFGKEHEVINMGQYLEDYLDFEIEDYDDWTFYECWGELVGASRVLYAKN